MIADTLMELANRAAPPALALVAPFNAKARRSRAGRSRAPHELAAWAAAHRDTDRPLVWLHAPSVGESLMAQGIAAALRRQRPDVQLAFTHFSPSAERVAGRVGADVATYLPWDTAVAAGRAVAAVQPSLMAFVRTEIWPAHMRAAERAGAPSVLVNAVLTAGSSRLRRPARRLLAPAYRRLAAAGAVSDEDADRLPLLGVDAGRVSVTGDARFDQVAGRVGAIDRDGDLLRAFAGERTIVAGSTWPADEAVLLPAFRRLRDAGSSARLVLVPHEPTPAHLAAADRACRRIGLTSVRLAAFESGQRAAVVIVDRVGVLADLYAVAITAFVGGGFGRSGLHSVVEPAALGVPVAFGPATGNAREAVALAAAGGGIAVQSIDELAAVWRTWLDVTAAREHAASAAAGFVASRLGGAARTATLILGLLD